MGMSFRSSREGRTEAVFRAVLANKMKTLIIKCFFIGSIKKNCIFAAMRENLQSALDIRERGDESEKLVQIKVAMATCGIAAGAKQVMEHMMEKANELKIKVVFTQTGCMGYCHAEPTIEVTVPGKEPVVFGNVDNSRADEILEKYVMNNELVEGIIPVNYEKID